jgi:hypothetical protein
MMIPISHTKRLVSSLQSTAKRVQEIVGFIELIGQMVQEWQNMQLNLLKGIEGNITIMSEHNIGDLVLAGTLGIITKIDRDFRADWYHVEWCSEGNEAIRSAFQDNEISYFKEALSRESQRG